MYINAPYLVHISYILCLFPFTCLCSNETSPVETTKNTPSSVLVAAPTEPTKSSKIADSDTKKVESIKKMNQIKGSKVKTTPTINSNIVTYRLNNAEDSTTCILMTVDALISFIYTTKLNQVEESDAFVPEKVDITGDCTNEDASVLIIKWKSFELTFNFAKTPGGERWFVNGVHLTFNTKETVFKHINHANAVIHSQTPEGNLLFITPVGKSFKCHREIEIGLSDAEFPDLKVKLLLRELTLEPFIFKNNDFGPEYLCAAVGAGSLSSETAPFIFGSLLALSTLFTIAGYSIYRYLKVNKVQYDTME